MESRPGVGVQRAAIRAIYPTCWVGGEKDLFFTVRMSCSFGGLRKGVRYPSQKGEAAVKFLGSNNDA